MSDESSSPDPYETIAGGDRQPETCSNPATGEKRAQRSLGSRTPRSRTTPIDADATIGRTAAEDECPPGWRGESKPMVSRYHRLSELGRGGWGVVDRVHDRQLDREVAVKRIVGEGDLDRNARDQFLHEAKITSQLQHPGVVPVHELASGGNGQEAYYVMKLLEGDTLRAHIIATHACDDGNKCRSSEVLRETITPLLERFVDVCNAVAYAHEQGIVHRDLKPANVMAGAFGETIVVDWGLAIEFEREPSPSGPTKIVGTPAYMAPEQAIGKSGSPVADLYALGVMLFEIIAGRQPYSGSPVTEVLKRVREGDCPELRDVQPATPKPLVAIVEKAMEFDPEERYQTADQLADEVRRFISGEAVQAYPESLFDRVARWCRRNRTLTFTIATAAAILLVVSTLFSVAIHRAHQNEQRSRQVAESAHREALGRLIEARDATDAWLVELSGTLEFYPGLKPIHDKLMGQAIDQYESLIATKDPHFEREPESETAQLTRLERAKCLLRLGDLYRMRADFENAGQAYAQSGRILNALNMDGPEYRLASNTSSTKPAFDQQVRLEKINNLIGFLLVKADEELSKDTELMAGVERQRAWLDRTLSPHRHPILEHRSEDALNPFAAKVASTSVRLELVLGRRGYENLAQQRQAVETARWLVSRRGTSGDQRLSETAQTELAETFERLQADAEAIQIWSCLIADLEQWSNATSRPDHLQSLAYSRIRRAALQIGIEQTEAAKVDYRRAIEDLHLAWQRTDSDSFFRVNLATAESNLGQLIGQGAAGRQEARNLLNRSLATYQELLREEVTPDLLRRLAQNHIAMTKLVPDDREPERVKHFRSACLVFQILDDHGELTSEDQRDWDTAKKAVAKSGL